MTQKPRILVMAHAHPDFSLGGGEIAAYNLYKAYRKNEGVSDAWFLARADRNRGVTGAITLRRSNEYLWEQGVADWHMMKAAHQDSLATWFADLIRAIKPTIVHAHHYAHLGLEFLRIIKQVDPSIKIFMTLHEYMAICSNNGQMIKNGSFKLCSQESFDDCSRCFPEKSPEDFWLRKHMFKSHFDFVDQFISPSDFLKARYVEWGISAERIVVIENGQADAVQVTPRSIETTDRRNRFGFFGQINPFKGLNVLLHALSEMTISERSNLIVEVHGANLELQSLDFQEKIEALSAPLIAEGVLIWIGPYEPQELRRRMENIDWVVVPSIWWENSPMVIQEAFVCGRPLICSDIGGMAEKVIPNVNGLHATAGSSLAWKNVLLSTVNDPQIWKRLHSNITKPLTHEECAEAHIALGN